MSRRHRVARTAAACGVALALSAVTGCGNFFGPDNCYVLPATEAPATEVAAANPGAGVAVSDSPAAAAAITGVYQAFFAPATATEDRMALVERGTDFETEIAGMANHIRTALTTVEIADVTVLDPTHAELRFTLSISGNPVVTNQIGHAVRESDGWKISATTMCGLVAISGGMSQACA
ncbi:hypothetical protein [Nocardia flavorosea]|uniref:Low molecular weight antigen MTB12-like C-terminal domain-containing protein n=1 Tax=Nocardia flavorosea TaxID=53429 RepID=A0A846YFC8_9NOCA|nr:hypothetical protein [Nocardia flavorosea]NKY57617.1 hypothetical protein [Nocardia flavorosea]